MTTAGVAELWGIGEKTLLRGHRRTATDHPGDGEAIKAHQTLHSLLLLRAHPRELVGILMNDEWKKALQNVLKFSGEIKKKNFFMLKNPF